jgi:outer membrane protein assembly factor BamA
VPTVLCGLPTERCSSSATVLAILLLASIACSKIPPGRSAVDSIVIVNAKTMRESDVEDKLATEASTRFLFLFQGVAYDYSVYDEAVLQRDMARVERFYRSNGFFDAHARVGRVFQIAKDHVRIEVVVDEGKPCVNRNVTLVGTETLPKAVATAVATAARDWLKRGSRFEEDKFKQSEGAVKKALTDRGYAFATVDSQAEADVGEHVVDFGFQIVPGPLAVFGPVSIVGLDQNGKGPRKQELPEGPLRTAIDIKQGSPYSTAAIDSATQALLDLEVFSAAEIVPGVPSPPPADRIVPLVVKVEPTRLRQITLGGGLEIDEIKTDLHLVGGWEDHNFLGGLRDFSVSFKPGMVLYPVRINNWEGPVQPLLEEWLKTELRQPGFIEARTTGFIRPAFNIFPLLVEVNPSPGLPVVGYRELKLPVGADRTFWKKVFVSFDYSLQVESPFAYVQTLDPGLETVVLSSPELITNLDFRDSAVRPHEGVYIGNTISVAGGIFGGTATDVRVRPEVRTYLPLARGLTFATRASVGFLWSSNYGKNWTTELQNSAAIAVSQTPARVDLEHNTQIMYFRGFFSGGPTTNRGFPLLGVSPHGVIPFLNPATASQQVMFSCNPRMVGFDPTKCYLPVGGFTLWELQNEVRAEISGPLSGTVFCDMGDVSPQEADIRLGHLHLSCGIGVAYDTPVGPIRLDVGYRIQPLQVLGFPDEKAAATPPGGDPVNGTQPKIFNLPVAVAIGIGQAY